ncbi:MAG TPA: toprim domain-containing protein, partial [Candidatus Paceibacterota bacterium]
VKFNNQILKPVHKNIFYVEKKVEGVESVEIALQYVDDISSRVLAFANNIYNSEGGMHITGFKTALTRTLNNYSRKNGLVKESEDNFTGEDVLEGLTVVVSVKMREIQFEGQTKSKLGSVEARGAVDTVFSEAFEAFLEENPDDGKAIINKVTLALKARKAAKAAKDSVLRKGALEGMTLPGKLADCETRSAEESELFIVEGDSAGGCFLGETKVALVDGRNLSFKELVEEDNCGKKNYCYTIDNEGEIAIGLIENPRITKKQAEVIKIVLDNDEQIICTPDHKFMQRDGSYKEAKNLKTSDSLMPLRKQLSRLGKRITIKGYELVFDPAEHRWIFTHLLSDRYNIRTGIYNRESGDSVHHLDFNKLNNNPNNLARLDRAEHLLHHTKHLEKTLHTESSKQKAREAHLTKEYREKIVKIMTTPAMRKMLSDRAKKQWNNPEYKKFMADKFLEFYHNNDDFRKSTIERLAENQKQYWNSSKNRKTQAKRVKEFFANNPEYKKLLSVLAKKQWQNSKLIDWRRAQTKKQWTSEFREKRKNTYNQTYLNKALKTLHELYLKSGFVDFGEYTAIRKETNDKSLVKWETLRDRFFEGDDKKLFEAVENFNHRIKKIEKISEKVDVYDIEVPETHNFALASGVFVHNSAKQGRDRRTQAILPLKGKILNVERARLDRILDFDEIKFLVIALGTAIGESFDITKLRYHKVIIATDADVDGAHIRTLLLTLFYRYFRALIDGGFIYIAQPPLYKIKKGKESFYAYSDEEKAKIVGKDAILDETGGEETPEGGEEAETEENDEKAVKESKDTKRVSKVSIQRYKGLGEMNPEELWETTMNPANRILRKVNVDDAREADKVFDVLMGTDVPARKSFIQSNAKKANIDV